MPLFTELLLQSRERHLEQLISSCVYPFYQQLKIHSSSSCFSIPVFSEQLLIFFVDSQSKSLGEEFIIKALYQKLVQDNFTEIMIPKVINILVEKTDCIAFWPQSSHTPNITQTSVTPFNNLQKFDAMMLLQLTTYALRCGITHFVLLTCICFYIWKRVMATKAFSMSMLLISPHQQKTVDAQFNLNSHPHSLYAWNC